MKIPTSPSRPELDALLAKARTHVMSAEEKMEQRRSWVRGELMLSHPEMTLDEANKMIADAENAP